MKMIIGDKEFVKDGDSFRIKFSMKYTEDFYNLSISSEGQTKGSR